MSTTSTNTINTYHLRDHHHHQASPLCWKADLVELLRHHPGLEAMGSSLIRSLIVQLNAISCVHFGPDSCLMAHLNAISIEFCALQWKQIVQCKSFLYFGDLSYLQPQSIPPNVCRFEEQQFLECTSLSSALVC